MIEIKDLHKSFGDLEVLKTYLAGLDWQVKRGVKALGLYERDGRWAYVDRSRAFAAGGEEVADMVQMEKCASIETALPEHPPISAERLMELLQRKMKSVKAATSFDLKNKLIRYGLSQGYDFEAVRDAADRIISTPDDSCENFF